MCYVHGGKNGVCFVLIYICNVCVCDEKAVHIDNVVYIVYICCKQIKPLLQSAYYCMCAHDQSIHHTCMYIHVYALYRC